MASTYGERRREGMHPQTCRNTVPAKFRNEAIGRLNLLTNKTHKDMGLREYAQIYATLHCHYGICDEANFITNDIITTILTQYHISKGLKVFGKAGADAVLKELTQLHERLVIAPLNGKDMTN